MYIVHSCMCVSDVMYTVHHVHYVVMKPAPPVIKKQHTYIRFFLASVFLIGLFFCLFFCRFFSHASPHFALHSSLTHYSLTHPHPTACIHVVSLFILYLLFPRYSCGGGAAAASLSRATSTATATATARGSEARRGEVRQGRHTRHETRDTRHTRHE